MAKELYNIDEVLADIFENENVGYLLYSNIESDNEYGEDINVVDQPSTAAEHGELPDVIESDENVFENASRVKFEKIYDLDSALNEDNYDMLPNISEHHSYVGILKRPIKKSDKGEEIIWSTISQQNVGRQPKSAVISGSPGVRGVAIFADTATKAWKLFFSSTMLDIVLGCTNERIK